MAVAGGIAALAGLGLGIDSSEKQRSATNQARRDAKNTAKNQKAELDKQKAKERRDTQLAAISSSANRGPLGGNKNPTVLGSGGGSPGVVKTLLGQ